MKEKVLLVVLILNLAFLIVFNKKLEHLELQVNKLSIKKMTKEETELKTKIIAKDMKSKAKAVLSIRCEDSKKPPKDVKKEDLKKYPKKWNGTASKIGENLVLTADHLVTNNDDKERVFPISCTLHQRGKEVGKFKSNVHKIKQVGVKDIAFLQVSFNSDGNQIPEINPEVYTELSVGENLVLITHPKTLINDYLITFGMVLNDDTEKILEGDRKKYWESSIITNMTAAPGSSGSPLFTLDGRFIGLHVGGDRDELQANYQMVFDSDFYLNYQMVKLFNWTEGKMKQEKK
jgi:hypothetical protein